MTNYEKLLDAVRDLGMDYEHIMCGPILANEKIRAFFRHKGM